MTFTAKETFQDVLIDYLDRALDEAKPVRALHEKMHVLRYYRKKNHLSVPELARALSMNASTIKVWETGHRSITRYTSEKMARFFETSADAFAGVQYVSVPYHEIKQFSKKKSVYVRKKERSKILLEDRIQQFLNRPRL